MPKFCRTSLLMFSCIQLQQQSVSFISPSFDQMLGLKMDCIFLEVFTLVPQFGQTFVPLFNFYHSSYNTYFFVLKLQLFTTKLTKITVWFVSLSTFRTYFEQRRSGVREISFLWNVDTTVVVGIFL